MQSPASESLTIRARAEQIADAYLPNGGRPSMVSDADTVQLFLAAIADGNYRETACRLAGIAKQTFYNTLKRAEAGDQAAIAFVDALEKAEAQAEAGIVRNVRRASELPQFWAAGMTLLERKSPDRWGRRQDDTSTPKVVVQLGVSGDRVQVNVLSPSVSQDFHSLTPSTDPNQRLIIGDYVNQRDGVPAPVIAATAADQAGGPAGSGMAPSCPAGAERGKGGRGGRKKKG